MNRFLTANGLNLGALLGFALVMGFGGAIISLLISKPMAKWSAGVRVIDAAADRPTKPGSWRPCASFADTGRHRHARGRHLRGRAQCLRHRRLQELALVAVSTGLLQGMTREEIEAVIGHEVAHVANGDMVTMTLIQGVMNTFVVFLSRVIGYAVDSFLRKGDDRNSGPGIGYWVTTIVLDIVLGFAAAIIVAWFSRQREFRADAGSAQLMGRKQPMINALARLGGMQPGRAAQERGGDGHHRRRGQAVRDAPADRGAHRGAAGAPRLKRRAACRYRCRQLLPWTVFRSTSAVRGSRCQRS